MADKKAVIVGMALIAAVGWLVVKRSGRTVTARSGGPADAVETTPTDVVPRTAAAQDPDSTTEAAQAAREVAELEMAAGVTSFPLPRDARGSAVINVRIKHTPICGEADLDLIKRDLKVKRRPLIVAIDGRGADGAWRSLGYAQLKGAPTDGETITIDLGSMQKPQDASVGLCTDASKSGSCRGKLEHNWTARMMAHQDPSARGAREIIDSDATYVVQPLFLSPTRMAMPPALVTASSLVVRRSEKAFAARTRLPGEFVNTAMKEHVETVKRFGSLPSALNAKEIVLAVAVQDAPGCKNSPPNMDITRPIFVAPRKAAPDKTGGVLTPVENVVGPGEAFDFYKASRPGP